MRKVDTWREALRRERDWTAYLAAHSGLPGPRGNLELVQAAALEADAGRLEGWLALAGPVADPDDPRVVALMAGVLGLGRLIAAGEARHWPRLRQLAGHPAWRVREAVAMALQTVGRADLDGLLARLRPWEAGSPLERRAVVAGLCEPDLLRTPRAARAVLDVLDRVTRSLAAEPDRRDEGVRVLRQALGYAWSVAAAALPAQGRPCLERLAASPDADLRWVLRENLRKRRLERLGEPWLARLRERVAGAGPRRAPPTKRTRARKT